MGASRKRGIYPFNPDLVVKPLTDREEREFIPLQGFDQIDGEGRGIPQETSPEVQPRNQSPTLSSSSIEEPNTPRSVKKSFQKLRKTLDLESPLAINAEKANRRFTRLERYTTIGRKSLCAYRFRHPTPSNIYNHGYISYTTNSDWII